MNQVLIIDKPAGMTSHDVIDRVRLILGLRSVGHLGTLDPAATGVLPLVVGNFTSSPPVPAPDRLQLVKDFGSGVLLFATKDAK